MTLFKKHFSARKNLVGTKNLTTSTPANTSKEHASTKARTAAKVSIQLPKSKSVDAEKNVTIMFFVNSAMCFLHHIVLIANTVYSLNSPEPNLKFRILQFCAFFMSVIRHATNFFIYYIFNIKFKKEFHILLVKLGIYKSADLMNFGPTSIGAGVN